ncbi:MAG: hypothetical protein PWQ73_632 [Petrotoga sp.]|nr:hypothetical protein [Petrotoga sp.]
MKKPWSISTTVRNPERLRGFLKVLKQLEVEGEDFTKKNQAKYQILLIKNRLYEPNNIPQKYQKYYDDPTLEIPFSVAKDIFEYQKYEDPPMRGRQSVNPLNKLGFAIAREGYGPIKITDLGNLFLKGDYDIGFIFFKSLLKLQFPNPWSKDFSEKHGFNIVPFIATLRLIRDLNRRSNVKGLSRDEFCLFIPTLINAEHIDEQIKYILAYRKITGKENRRKFIVKFTEEFYEILDVPEKKINNLFDYGDNTMRYFRLTRYFRIETDPLGYHWRIDLEPSRMSEIEQLLSIYDGTAFKFKDISEYLDYISDINKPILPWEKLDNLKNIALNIKKLIINTLEKEGITLSKEEVKILKIDINSLDKASLEKHISNLRELNRNLNLYIKKRQLLGNIDKIKEIIEILENQRLLRRIEPETFEKIITEALKIINDELLIKPNYPMDDEGEPLTHAPGNKPDIECYYETFKAICEVTLNTSNSQWVQEGQPVMRHLRDFEKVNDFNDNIYCIFVAPKIHRDTYSQFWISVKYEYDGRPQKIIPLTAKQFALLLRKLLEYIENGKKFTHHELYKLYNLLIKETANISGFSGWAERINQVLELWVEEKI